MRKPNNLNLGGGREVRAFANILGIEEIHQGVEVEANAKINKYLKVNAMLSLGDWFYKGDATGTLINENSNPIDLQGNEVPAGSAAQTKLFLEDVKVGTTAQTTAALGLIVSPIDNLKIDIDWRYVDNLYANLNVSSFTTEAAAKKGALRLPAYHLFDLGASYKWQLTEKQRISLFAHVYNLLDTYYINESYDNIHTTDRSMTYKGIDVNNRVYFGDGRTFSFGVRYNF